MTDIKKTLDKTQEIITNLINRIDYLNLKDWDTGKNEKKEITDLLAYLKDKSQPKPASVTDDIEMDLTEIEALETNLTTLTEENTRLATENLTLTTKNNEQGGIINDTTVPNLITKLEQFANKITDSELKTSLDNIKTELANLKKGQEAIKDKGDSEKASTNYWGIATSIGVISLIVIKGWELFNNKKKESDY